MHGLADRIGKTAGWPLVNCCHWTQLERLGNPKNPKPAVHPPFHLPTGIENYYL